MKFTKRIVLFSLGIVTLWFTSSLGGKLSNTYPLVRDSRNFKESVGGKSVPAQGRILERSLKSHIIHEELLSQKDDETYPWRYVVSVNCKRGGRALAEIIRKVGDGLLPQEERSRLALIVGINEKVTVENPVGYRPEWKDLLPEAAVLQQIDIPVLFHYVQWTSFRSGGGENSSGADEIREQLLRDLQKLKEADKERVYLNEFQELLTEDRSQGFPFGAIRACMLNNPESQRFIKSFSGPNTAVYIHIQDADFVKFEETPLFYDFLPRDKERVFGGVSHLFKKYDALIQTKRNQTGMMPLVVGGAHVYSPQEELGPEVAHSQKIFTRFAGEMGNMVKYYLGQFQPYGLYFHEPNTLLLHPSSYGIALEKSPDRKSLMDPKHGRISFGIDSELQIYTRNLFKDVSDQGRRDLMEFSASIVLSTSMSRGKGDSFVLQMGGTYEEKTKKFNGWTYKDIMASHGMAQEVLHPNKWASSVATSMADHLSQDARSELAKLFNLFDPHAMSRSKVGSAYTREKFFQTLIDYDEHIKTTQDSLKEYFSHLRCCYGKQLQGDLIAFACVSLAWECGQGMRAMFLQSFQPPESIDIKTVKFPEEVARFLACRFDGLKTYGFPEANPFVLEVLGLNRIPLCMTVRDMASTIAFLLVEFKKTKKAAAEALKTTSGTLRKMQDKTSPIKSKKVVEEYLEATKNPEKPLWGLTWAQRQNLAQELH